MREILFRGQPRFENRWIYGSYVKIGDNHMIIDESNHSLIGICYFGCIPETICQYTNKNDMDGQKIFLGDKLNIGPKDFGFITDGKEKPAIYEVKSEGCDYILYRPDLNLTWGRLSRLDKIGWDCKVVGNIFDNPELLNNDQS